MSVIWGKRGNVVMIKPIEIPYPSYVSPLVYTGDAIYPEWINYDVSKINISGTTFAVDVGTYTAIFKPKDGYCWPDETVDEYSLVWKIYKGVITKNPSQSKTLTYNGVSQSPTWNNYDSTKLELSGTTEGTKATTYTVYFTPRDGYVWSDETNVKREVTWTIERKTRKLTVTPSSLTMSLSKDVGGVELQVSASEAVVYYLNITASSGTSSSLFSTSIIKNNDNPAIGKVIPKAIGSGTLWIEDIGYNSDNYRDNYLFVDFVITE